MYDWVSIPELGNRFQLDKACASELLEGLGLRWHQGGEVKFRHDVFQDSIARRITPDNGYEVVQWNYLAIRAIINDTYPAEGWRSHAELAEFTRHMPF